MRRQHKDQVLEMLDTLSEAHDEITSYLEKGLTQLADNLLIQCQEAAINIGNYVEAFEGEGFITVSYLEEYCEVVFSIHEELQSGGSNNPHKVSKKLNKGLIRITNSINNDIRVKKEVVFFPYKASMWDSLESVYLKFKADPEWDAYCVPIPYYDVKPDHTLGQLHYEGREYPKNIEVIDYTTYNLEERHPDAIYIHNPYDNWNLVTRVPDRYFSYNLKKYTDELVYIPYFVLAEVDPNNQAAVDGMKHFIWLPGVVNADKVILQSEDMKKIYVNEYLKTAVANGLNGNHIDRNYLEQKFQGTGSPKLEKIKNTKKEDIDIPEEWLKIIEKPDGSWKKIILYNNSIGALLEKDAKMLTKMEDVFKIFKENKDDVALLWRPHPLIQSTIESMRPQLWLEYQKLVIRYRTENWGIYDDSSDLDRAIAISDAYYGDGSSVVQLCQAKGMPVMIQNVDVMSE